MRCHGFLGRGTPIIRTLRKSTPAPPSPAQRAAWSPAGRLPGPPIFGAAMSDESRLPVFLPPDLESWPEANITAEVIALVLALCLIYWRREICPTLDEAALNATAP